MKTVVNVPRETVRNWHSYLDPNEVCWISIEEPDIRDSRITNEFLDELNHLKIAFWDIVSPVQIIGKDQIANPPTGEDAKKIVDFLLANQDKNVIVNCKKGISRSSGVAQFCQDFLNYKWLEEGQKIAVPNKLLYRLMKDYYSSFNPQPVKTIDKRKKLYE